jgi:hypothetical protein
MQGLRKMVHHHQVVKLTLCQNHRTLLIVAKKPAATAVASLAKQAEK